MKKKQQPPQTEQQAAAETKKNKGKAGKVILIIIALLAVALAAFFGVVKYLDPSFSVLPKGMQEDISKAVRFVDEDLLGHTEAVSRTTEPVSLVPVSTTVTTTKPAAEYLPIEEFATESAKGGNLLGNILNGGKVGTDMTYIYHIVDGEGIYRFNPLSEEAMKYYSTVDKLSSLNLRGEYLYFVNEQTQALYRLKKGSQKTEKLADNVRLAYLYDATMYYVTNDNSLYLMPLGELQAKKLYSSHDNAMQLVGISNTRVFFTVTNFSGNQEYMTIDNEAKEKVMRFRAKTEKDELLCPVLENGFLYYYLRQSDGSYTLYRQKYGSQLVVPLVEKVSVTSVYPAVEMNRLYYAVLDGNRFSMMEMNMNSKDVKVLLSTGKTDASNTLTVQHAQTYDFILGYRGEQGGNIYAGSCIYTSSNNVMWFENSRWSY